MIRIARIMSLDQFPESSDVHTNGLCMDRVSLLILLQIDTSTISGTLRSTVCMCV